MVVAVIPTMAVLLPPISKYPIVEQAQHVFDNCRGTDCAADKGVLYTKIIKIAALIICLTCILALGIPANIEIYECCRSVKYSPLWNSWDYRRTSLLSSVVI
ncbi:hypothetical protein OK016_17260 [Vibrio chagasii]|nr:hypothetical protein [Vibrio chagasii]